MWHGTLSTAYEEGDGWIIKDVANFYFPKTSTRKADLEDVKCPGLGNPETQKNERLAEA